MPVRTDHETAAATNDHAAGRAASEAAKRPFDAEVAFTRIRDVMRGYPKAGLIQLADLGYGAPFELLAACVLSIRTLDEVMVPAARRLLDVARTPAQIAALTPDEIDALIQPCVFHTPKSRTIHAMAARIVAEHGGKMPCDEHVLLEFAGVGPKCANLVLGFGCGQPKIGVDVHVHRVVNRWGIVATAAPDATMAKLEELLPQSLWTDTNRLLMPFGKFICTGRLPHCSTCPVLDMCCQVGVTSHR
jgi:endonuclease III